VADVALAIGGPAAGSFPAVATMPVPGVVESTELAPADPFAALFATLATPAMAPPVTAPAPPSPIAIPQIPGDVVATEAAPLLRSAEDALAEAETDDALEGAIAAGPTAVLALTFAPPPMPTSATKAPEEASQSRRAQLLAGSAAIANPGALPDQTDAALPTVKLPPAALPGQDARKQNEAEAPILPDVVKPPLLGQAKQLSRTRTSPDAAPPPAASSAPVFHPDRLGAHLPQASEMKAPQIDSGRPTTVPATVTMDTLPRTEMTMFGLEQRLGPNLPEPGIATTAAAPTTDIGIARQLVIARDGLWLDTLARDITHAAGAGSGAGTMNFTLSPPHLGALAVAIAATDDGAAIRLTADTQAAHDIITDHQPQLIAEARAHGLRVAETQVDLRQDSNNSSPRSDPNQGQTQSHGQGQANSQSGQSRQSSTAHQPFSRSPADEPGSDPAAPGQPDALYA
jgi:flagellar hook-length control protein FliK